MKSALPKGYMTNFQKRYRFDDRVYYSGTIPVNPPDLHTLWWDGNILLGVTNICPRSGQNVGRKISGDVYAPCRQVRNVVTIT
jgi:hypothetical protein